MPGRIEAASRSCKHIECPLVSPRWCSCDSYRLLYTGRAPRGKRLCVGGGGGQAVPGLGDSHTVWICLQNVVEVLAQAFKKQAQAGSWTETALSPVSEST